MTFLFGSDRMKQQARLASDIIATTSRSTSSTTAGDGSMKSMWELGGLSAKQLLKHTWRHFWKDRVLDRSAVLSFYFLLALFPLILLLMTMLGMVLESGPVFRETLHEYLSSILPRSASTLVDTTLGEIRRRSGALKFSFALVFSWWSAAKGMLAIVDGLNIAYEVDETRPWWKKYLIASALTIVSLVLFASSILITIEGGRLSEDIARYFGHGDFVIGAWQGLRWILLLGVIAVAFNVLYTFAPNLKHRQWHWLTPGTVVGMSLWLLSSLAFKTYLSFFNQYSATYGSIGAVIILLLWLYLSGAAILVGGAVNSAIERASTSGLDEERNPGPTTTPELAKRDANARDTTDFRRRATERWENEGGSTLPNARSDS